MTAPQALDAPPALTATGRLTWHGGAVVVVTVTANDPAVLARRLDRALAAFAAYAAAPGELEPAPPPPVRPALPATHRAPARASAQPQPPAGPPPPPVCATHGQPLTWRTPKDGGPGWWSHRTHDGGWCRG